MALKSTERRVDELELNKQNNLVSGVTIKTVNSNSLLGSGNISVQPTLVSGTNIKTINGNTLLGSGDLVISPSSTITVGTTPVTSGTDGRVFFQSGGVVQQDAGLFWDNTNKRLGVGGTPAAFKLDVNGTFRAQGQTQLLDDVTIAGGKKLGIGIVPTIYALDINGTTRSNGAIYATNFGTLSGDCQIITAGVGNKFVFTAGGSFSIGATTAGARLDIRAQGALSTDIAFRVRNSADTANLVQFRGNGSHIIGDGTWGITINNTTANHLVNGNIAFVNNIDIRGNITHTNGVSDISFRTTQAPITNGYSLNPYYERFVFGSTTSAGFGTGNPSRFIGIVNGTAPNGVITDSFALYSADIVAGNAAPHFRTENGNIIKLFTGAALTASDGTLANAVTRIAELEARLQAHGLIA